MPIYTKTGDAGTTGNLLGKRMSKSDQLAQVLGTLDELNSWIGVCRATSPLTLSKFLEREFRLIQNNLMCVATGLAGSKKRIDVGEVERMEKMIDKLTEELPILTKFIYPVGFLQLTRTVARRAEREVVSYKEQIGELPDDLALKYLNRLSDVLFTLGRWVNFKTGVAEEKWEDKS